MSRLMDTKWSWIEGSHGMRTQLLDLLSDSDLAFSPGGQNMPFGALCREMGEVQHSYIQSFKTFTQDFDYRNTEAGLDSSVARLKAWFQKLDDELKAVVAAIPNADSQKMIQRPGGFPMPVDIQLDVYLQALLIFFGKAVVYLRAMDRTPPQNFQDWIG